jgi:hypothetical protein
MMSISLLDLNNDRLNIIGDYVKNKIERMEKEGKDNYLRMEKEKTR